MNWVKINYSKSNISRAGKQLLEEVLAPGSLLIVDNWRASHAFPLHVITMNLRRNHPDKTIVVQRLKRLDSIVNKLKRNEDMNLARMNDIAGCRVIVDSLPLLHNIIDTFKNSRIRHILASEYDYISKPKESGYRSIHLVYKYHSDEKIDYNGLRVEIQFRTRLQHLWATAVEVLGIYTHDNLKASIGDEAILRFLTLASALFSLEESTTLVPNVPSNKKDIILELRKLNNAKNITKILSAIKASLSYTDQKELSGNGYYLLILNLETRMLKFEYYAPSHFNVAIEKYNDCEKQINNHIDVVLVNANSFENLKKAYPNYFTDISEFISRIEALL